MVDKIYRIYGLVQGVGFRPFLTRLARERGLRGFVRNDGGIVTARFIGEEEAVDGIICRLLMLDGKDDEIPGAIVDRVAESEDSSGGEYTDFIIEESSHGSDRLRMLPPDIATCPSCVRELFDPGNRRYHHPFISCTACGPRYTIMHGVPYDRDRTAMRDFPLCDKCESEYEGVTSHIRHFAQTICCNDCGPKLYGRTVSGAVEDPLSYAVSLLRGGGIVAVKGVGGYHLCFDALSMASCERLRDWKARERKPFAVMFSDIDRIREYAVVSKREEELLTSPEAPIVLLRIREDRKLPGAFLEGALGGSNRIGAFLPSNPIQHLLLREMSPLVMTSANRGGEPIIISDADMISLMDTGIPDMVLCHDREILYGLDDSICQVSRLPGVGEAVQLIRRARGYVPSPVFIKREFKRDCFSAGGDLKSVFAMGRDSAVYMSGHFGDLIEKKCADARSDSIEHFKELLGIEPVDFSCDMHPGYVSVSDARDRADLFDSSMRTNRQEGGFPEEKASLGDPGSAQKNESILVSGRGVRQVQHHFAHILSVAAEEGLCGSVLGVAYDGTGYGDDGSVWGGEFLLCDTDTMTYERVGHLYPVPLVGGDGAARDGRRSAFSFLISGGMDCDEAAYVSGLSESEATLLHRAIALGINTVPCSSMGRLFDAAAAILGICNDNSYEGECPIRLQYAAERAGGADTALRLSIYRENGVYIADTVSMLMELYKKSSAGMDAGELAYAFHEAVAAMTASLCKRIIADRGLEGRVALSGGTMYNSLLLGMICDRLQDYDIKPYINSKVPAGDGGLALGQIFALTDEGEQV